MADDVLKKYEIQITANTDELEKNLAKAEKSIHDFSNKKGLDKSILGQFNQVQESIAQVSQEVKNLKGTITSNANSLKGFSEDAKKSYEKLATEVTESVSKITTQMTNLETSTKDLFDEKLTANLNKQFESLSENINKVVNQYESFGKVFKEFSEGKINSDTMGGLISSFSGNKSDLAKAQQDALDMMKKQKKQLENTATQLKLTFNDLFGDKDYDGLSGLLNDSKFSVGEFDIKELKDFSVQLQNFVTDVKKNMNALAATGGLSEFFKGDFLGNVNDKTLDAFQKKLTKQINGFIQNGETGVSQESKKIEIGVQLADTGDLSTMKKELKSKIIEPLQKEADANKIKLGYEITDDKGVMNEVKLNLQADTDAITESIRAAVQSINVDLQSESAPKLKLRAEIDKDSVSASLNDGSPIDLGNIKAELGKLSTATISTDGLATEATLSSILTTLQTIGKKTFGDQWEKERKYSAPSSENERHYINYAKMLGFNLPTDQLSAAGQARLETVKKGRISTALGRTQQDDIKAIWKSIISGEGLDVGLEALRKTKYYGASTNRVIDYGDGSVRLKKLAAYADDGATESDEWKAKLEKYYTTIYNTYQENMQTFSKLQDALLRGEDVTIGVSKADQMLNTSQKFRTIKEKGFGKLLNLGEGATNVSWKDILVAQLKAEQDNITNKETPRKKFLASRQFMIDDLMNTGNYSSREAAGTSVIAKYYTDQIKGVQDADDITDVYREALQKALDKISKGIENAIYRMDFADDAQKNLAIKKELGIDATALSYESQKKRGTNRMKAGMTTMYPGELPSKKGQDSYHNQNWGGAKMETDRRKNGGNPDTFIARAHTGLNEFEGGNAILGDIAGIDEQTQETVENEMRLQEALKAQVKLRERLLELAKEGKVNSAEWNALYEGVVLTEDEVKTKSNIEGMEKSLQRLKDKKLLQPSDWTTENQEEYDRLEKNLKFAQTHKMIDKSTASNKLTSGLGITVSEANDLASIYIKRKMGESLSSDDVSRFTELRSKVLTNKNIDINNGQFAKEFASLGVDNELEKSNAALNSLTNEIKDLEQRLGKATSTKDRNALTLQLGTKEAEKEELENRKQSVMKKGLFFNESDYLQYILNPEPIYGAISENIKRINSEVQLSKDKKKAIILGDGTSANPGWIMPFTDEESYKRNVLKVEKLKAENNYYNGLGVYTHGYEPMRNGGYSSRYGAYTSFAGVTSEEKARRAHNEREIKELELQNRMYEEYRRYGLGDEDFDPATVVFGTEEERKKELAKQSNKKSKHNYPTLHYEAFDNLLNDRRNVEVQQMFDDVERYNELQNKNVGFKEHRIDRYTDEEHEFIDNFEKTYGSIDNFYKVLRDKQKQYQKELEPEYKAVGTQAVIEDYKYYENAAKKTEREINKSLKESQMYGTGKYGALGESSPAYRKDIRSLNNTRSIAKQLKGNDNDTVMAQALRQREAAKAEIENIKSEIIKEGNLPEVIDAFKEVSDAKNNQQKKNAIYEKSEQDLKNLASSVLDVAVGRSSEFEQDLSNAGVRKYLALVDGQLEYTPAAFNQSSEASKVIASYLKADKNNVKKILDTGRVNRGLKASADDAVTIAAIKAKSIYGNHPSSIEGDYVDRFLDAEESMASAQSVIDDIAKNPDWKKYDKIDKQIKNAEKLPKLADDIQSFLGTLPPDIRYGIIGNLDNLAAQRMKKDSYKNSVNGTSSAGYQEAARNEKASEDALRRLENKLNPEDRATFTALKSEWNNAQSKSGIRTILDVNKEKLQEYIEEKEAERQHVLEGSNITVASMREQAHVQRAKAMSPIYRTITPHTNNDYFEEQPLSEAQRKAKAEQEKRILNKERKAELISETDDPARRNKSSEVAMNEIKADSSRETAQDKANYYQNKIDKLNKRQEEIKKRKKALTRKKSKINSEYDEDTLFYLENRLYSVKEEYDSRFADFSWIDQRFKKNGYKASTIESVITGMFNDIMSRKNTDMISTDEEKMLLSLIARYKQGGIKSDGTDILNDLKATTKFNIKKFVGDWDAENLYDSGMSLNDFYELELERHSSALETAEEELDSFKRTSKYLKDDVKDKKTVLTEEFKENVEELKIAILQKVKEDINAVVEKLPGNGETKSGKFYNTLMTEIDDIVRDASTNDIYGHATEISKYATSKKSLIEARQKAGSNKTDYDKWLSSFNKKTKQSAKSKYVLNNPMYAGWTSEDILKSHQVDKAQEALQEEYLKQDAMNTHVGYIKEKSNEDSEFKRQFLVAATGKRWQNELKKEKPNLNAFYKTIGLTNRNYLYNDDGSFNAEALDNILDNQNISKDEISNATLKKVRKLLNGNTGLRTNYDILSSVIENPSEEVKELKENFKNLLPESFLSGKSLVTSIGAIDWLTENYKQNYNDYSGNITEAIEAMKKAFGKDSAKMSDDDLLDIAQVIINGSIKEDADRSKKAQDFIDSYKRKNSDTINNLEQFLNSEYVTGKEGVRGKNGNYIFTESHETGKPHISRVTGRYVDDAHDNDVNPNVDFSLLSKNMYGEGGTAKKLSVAEAKAKSEELASDANSIFGNIVDAVTKSIAPLNAATNNGLNLNKRFLTQEEQDAKDTYNKAWNELLNAQKNQAVASVVQQLQEEVNKAKVDVDKFGTLGYSERGYAKLKEDVKEQRKNIPLNEQINSTIRNDDYRPKSYASQETPWVEGLATEDTLRQIYNAITEGNRILGTGEDRIISHDGDLIRSKRMPSGDYANTTSNSSAYNKYKQKDRGKTIPDSAVSIDNSYDKKIPFFAFNSKKNGKKTPTTEADALTLVQSLSDDDLSRLVSYGDNGDQQKTLSYYLTLLRNSTSGLLSAQQLDDIAKKAGLELTTGKNGKERYKVSEVRVDSDYRKRKSNLPSPQPQPVPNPNPQPNPQPNNNNNPPTPPNNNNQQPQPNPQPNPAPEKKKKGKKKQQPNIKTSHEFTDEYKIGDLADSEIEKFIKDELSQYGKKWERTGYEENKQNKKGQLSEKTIKLRSYNKDLEDWEYRTFRFGTKEDTKTHKTVAAQLEGSSKTPNNSLQEQLQMYRELQKAAEDYVNLVSNMSNGTTPVDQKSLALAKNEYAAKKKAIHDSGFTDKAKNKELDNMVKSVTNENLISNEYKKIAKEMYGSDSIAMRKARGIDLNSDTQAAQDAIVTKLQEADKELDNLVQMGVVSQETKDELIAYRDKLKELVENRASSTDDARTKAALRATKSGDWRDYAMTRDANGVFGTSDKWNAFSDEAKQAILERDYLDALYENQKRDDVNQKSLFNTLNDRIRLKAKSSDNMTPLNQSEITKLSNSDSIVQYLYTLNEIEKKIVEINKINDEEAQGIKSANDALNERLKAEQEILNLRKSQNKTEGGDYSFAEMNAKYGYLKDASGSPTDYVFSDNYDSVKSQLQKMNAGTIASLFEKDFNKVNTTGYTEYATTRMDELLAEFENHKNMDISLFDDEQIEKVYGHLKDMRDELVSLEDTGNAIVSDSTLSKMSSNFESWLSKNSKAFVKYRNEIEEIRAALTNVNQSNYSANELNAYIENLKAQATAAGDIGQTFFDQINSRFKNLLVYLSSFVQFYDIIRYFQQGISVVKEYDDAMTDLKKVAQGTTEQIEAFGKESYSIADSIGSTNTSIIQAATEWARLGKDMTSAKELAQASTIYSNVGEVDATTATQDLISAMNAFSIADDQAMSVVDKMNEIGNNYAVSSAQLGEILEKSSASLAVSGDDIDHVIAMGAAMNSVVQDASTVGSTLKIVGLRLRGTSTEIEAMGEETDGMAESTSKLRSDILALTNVDGKGGFDIMKNNKEYKTTYDILKGISSVWDEMSQIDQSALLEEIAGKNRAQGAAALIANFDTAEKALQDSLNAEGSAMEENSAYMDSISAHQAQLSNAWNELWTNTIDKDVVVFFTDLGTTVLRLVNNFGSLKSIITAVSTLMFGVKPTLEGQGLFSVSHSNGKVSGVKLNEGNIFGQIIGSFKNRKEPEEFADESVLRDYIQKYMKVQRTPTERGELIDKMRELADSDNNQGVTKHLVRFFENKNSLSKQIDNEDDAVKDYNRAIEQTQEANNKFTASNMAAEAAVGIFNVALTGLASFALTAVVGALADVISYVTTYDKTLRESASVTSAAYKEDCDSIDEYAERVADDYETINNNASSIEEIANARTDLMTVQDELIAKFGDEEDWINKITDAVSNQTSAWQELKDASWEAQKTKFISENTENGFWGDVKGLGKSIASGIGSLMSGGKSAKYNHNDPIQNLNNQIMSQKLNFGDLRTNIGGVISNKDGDIKGSDYLKWVNGIKARLGVDENSNIAYTDIYSMIDILKEAKNEAKTAFAGASDNAMESLNNGLDVTIAQYQTLLDEQGEFFDQYIENEKIPESSIKEFYDNLQKAYDNYTEAYSNGDESAKNTALETFNENLKSIQSDSFYQYNAPIKHYIDNLYSGVQLEANKHQFELKFDADTDDTKDRIESALNKVRNSMPNSRKILTKDYISGLDETNEGFKELKELAEESNLEIDSLLSKLQEMGQIKTSSYQELAKSFSEDKLDKLTNDQISEIYGGTKSYKDFLSTGLGEAYGTRQIFDMIYGDDSKFTDYQRDWMATSDKINEFYQSLDNGTPIEKMNKAIAMAGETTEVLRYRLTNTSANVSDLTESATSLNTAMDETYSSGKLSADTLTDLNSKIEDTSDLLILSSDGVKLNADAMDDYIDTQAKDKTEELNDIYQGYLKKLNTAKNNLETLEEASAEINSTNGELSDGLYTLTDGTKVTADNIESLTAAQNENVESAKKQIQTISNQMGALKELTSAYNKYIKATSTKNQGDRFDTVTSAYESTKKLYDNGQYYTDDVMQFTKLFGNPDATKGLNQNSSRSDVQSAAKAAMATYEKYMTDDAKGPEKLYTNLYNAIEKAGGAIDGANFVKDESGNVAGINVSDFDKAAKSIGLVGDVLEIVMEKAQEYQGNDIFTYTGIDKTTEDIVKDINAANKAISENTEQTKENSSAKDENKKSTEEVASAISSDVSDAITAKKQAAIDEVTKAAAEEANEKLDTLVNVQVEVGATFSQEDYDAVIQRAIDLKHDMEKAAEGSVEYQTASDAFDKLFEDYGYVFGDSKDAAKNIILTADVTGYLESTSSVDEEQQKIENWFDKTFTLKVDTTEAGQKLASISSYYTTVKDAIEQNPIEIKTNTGLSGINLPTLTNNGGGSGDSRNNNEGRHGVEGGIALADGTMNDMTPGNTLVGELGQELVVDRSTGEWRTVGDNGAEFTNIDKGDIVFNANQTKALLSSGHINGRGKALAGGQNNHLSGTALTSGTMGLWDHSGEVTTNETKKNTKATEKNTKATEDNTDETKETYNWIEVLANNIEHQREITSSTEAETEWNSYSSRISGYRKLIEYDKQLVETYTTELYKYSAEIDEKYEGIRKAFGDDTATAEKYINLVKNGSLGDDWKTELIQEKAGDNATDEQKKAVEKAYTNQTKAISDAQEWISSLQTAETNQVKWLKQQHEDLKAIYDLQLEQNKALIDALDSEISAMETQIDMKGTVGDIVTTGDYEDLIAATDDKISRYYEQIDILQNELSELGDDMDSAEYQEIEASIAECNAQILECEKSQAEWNETIKQLPIDHIESYIENIKTAQSDLNDYIAELEAAGKKVTSDIIKQQMEVEQLLAKQYTNEISKVYKNLNTYTAGSTKWNEAFQNLQTLDDEISSIVQNMIGFNKQLLAMPVDTLADVSDQLSSISEGLTAVQDDNLTVINAAIDTITRNAEELTKPLQKQLDLLQKTSEQRKRQLDIEQAAWDLEKAKQNKSVQVVKNGKITYEADQDSVRQAQNSYDEALDSKKQGELSDQIDKINDDADDLKEKWEKIQSDSEYKVDIEAAAKLAGMSVDEFKQRVLTNNDDELYHKTKNSYEDTAQQQAAVEEMSNTLSTIQTLIEEINTKYLAGQLTADQAKQMVQQLINAGKDGLSGQENLDNRLNIEQQESANSAVQDAKDSIAKTTEEYNKVVQQTVDNTAIIAEYQKKENELTEEIKNQLEKANEAYQNTLKAETTHGSYSSSSRSSSGGSSSSSDSGVWKDKPYYIRNMTVNEYFDKVDSDKSSGGHSSASNYTSSKSSSSSSSSSSSGGPGVNLHYADGIENGAISLGANTASEKFRILQDFATNGFKASEVPIIADLGEAVLNPKQQSNVLNAINQSAASGVVAGAKMRSISPVVNISLGDMTLPNVTNGSEFAQTLSQTIEPTMNQYFSKFFK